MAIDHASEISKMSDTAKQFYSGPDVLNLAAEIAETAAQLAKSKGLSPKDAKDALQIASQVIIGKKAGYTALIKEIADSVTAIGAVQLVRNTDLQTHIDRLVRAVDSLLDEK